MIGIRDPRSRGDRDHASRSRFARQACENRAVLMPCAVAPGSDEIALVELQERLFEPRRFDRQVVDRRCRRSLARNGPTSPSSRQVSQPSPVDDLGHAGNAASGRRRTASRSSTFRLRLARSAGTSSSATSRPSRMMRHAIAHRSTSDRTCDEKKIVRPSRAGPRGSSRRPAASAGRGPRRVRRGSPAPGRAGAPG
jgi:hypothetical protein